MQGQSVQIALELLVDDRDNLSRIETLAFWLVLLSQKSRVAADIAVLSRHFSFCFASMFLCSCAELLLIVTRPFDRVDTDKAHTLSHVLWRKGIIRDSSGFVNRDEADILDEKQANEKDYS
jgi:hypothetical protein